MNMMKASPPIVNMTRVTLNVAACLFFALPNVLAQDAQQTALTAELKQAPASELAATSIQKGDVVRGKAMFNREKLGCIKCHTSPKGKPGQHPIGPDLTTIADRLSAEQIIESVLYPNKQISKGYQSYIVLTLDGVVHNGVLVSQSAQETVLANPETNALIRIAANDVDKMQKTKSAMPEELVHQLGSRQEFYDLIRFLTEQKASASGTPVNSKGSILIKEVATDKNRLPLLAVARPDGVCYLYDPNNFRLDSIWKGALGWESEDGSFTLNQAAAESFHIRDKPWKIDVGRVQFDFKWTGHLVNESGIVMRYTLKDKTEGREWTVEESIEISSLLQQRLHFRISHPSDTNEVLTYWLAQTNFRNVSTNGQQAQRDQLEFLKPGQSQFTLNLSRRRSGQTIPNGYSISQIEGPKPEQPFLFEPTSFSFAKDGTAFVSTRTGSIWRYQNQNWNLFANGLQETQGVQVASNGLDVYTMQKPELTLLKDTNSDGQADLYQSIANGFRYTGHYHEFAFGPVRNKAGDLFFSTGLSASGHHEAKKSGTGQMSSALGYRGWVLKVNPDGKLIPYASGLRSPAGIGMNSDDELFITDNQGDWVASSYLGHVAEGDFMGHPAALWDREEYGITPRQLDYKTVDARVSKIPPLDEAKFTTQRKRPAVWLIHGDLTNSPGNPSFCPPQGFGPFAGQAFIADISHRAIVRVALEKVNGVFQGAVFPFIRPLGSASFSTSFDPEGNLWVGSVGRGWTTGDPMIEVISFDKTKPPFEIQRIELKPTGFDVHLTQPLAEAGLAGDQISVKQFHYLYWAEYGSDRQDVTNIPVTQFTVSEDRKTLHLNAPVAKSNIYEIDLGLIRSASGLELKNNYSYYTVNEVVK